MTKWLLILCNVLWIGKWSLIEFTQNQSCSRVHAALVHHKHLNRAFLVDLGSTHGTYIGSVRLEGHKPTPLPMDRYACCSLQHLPPSRCSNCTSGNDFTISVYFISGPRRGTTWSESGLRPAPDPSWRRLRRRPWRPRETKGPRCWVSVLSKWCGMFCWEHSVFILWWSTLVGYNR